MSLLLYIESSPRKKRSASTEVAESFIAAFKNENPTHEVEHLDLWHTQLPEFDGDVIDAKYSIMHGQAQTEAQHKAWFRVEELIRQFKHADSYLFSVPMWNFTIPYKLKHYIDLIVQPSYTFTFSPEQGYKGLVTGKPVTVVYARGGDYHAGSGVESLDLQTKYMESILKFIGFTDITHVIAEPTAGPDKAAVVLRAKKEAEKLATRNK